MPGGLRRRQLCGEPIIDHAVRHAIVVVGKELDGVRPAHVHDVAPHHRGAVAIEQLAPMGVRIVHVGRSFEDRRVDLLGRVQSLRVQGPVHAAGVVETGAQAPRTHRSDELSDQVAPRLVSRTRQVSHAARPQQIAVRVLGGQHDVARPGGLE